jgi:hypothetical protein
MLLVDAKNLARFGCEFRWPLLASVGGTKDQPVAIEREDAQNVFPASAPRVSVKSMALGCRVESSLNIPLLIERLFDAVSLVSNLLPVALKFLQVFRAVLCHLNQLRRTRR